MLHLLHIGKTPPNRRSSRSDYEREKMALQLENEMLKFERRLLTGQSKDKDAE